MKQLADTARHGPGIVEGLSPRASSIIVLLEAEVGEGVHSHPSPPLPSSGGLDHGIVLVGLSQIGGVLRPSLAERARIAFPPVP